MTEAMAFKLIEATLRDGRHVRIRAIRPDDRDEVVQAFDRLSSESRYTRFMAPMLDAAWRRSWIGRSICKTRTSLGSWRRSTHRTASTSWPARATTSCLAGSAASLPSPSRTAGKGLASPAG